MATTYIIIFLQFTAICITSSHASSSPVLMWRNSKTNFPSQSIGHTVNRETFKKDYVAPHVENNVLVTFVQDQLSLEDLTMYGDVYNENTNGGAFHNLKTIMDTQTSVQLSSVEDPMDSLTASVRQIHKLSSPFDFSTLKLDTEQKHTIVIELPAVGESDTLRQAYAHSDAIIGSVIHQLNEMNMLYTAAYTGKSSKASKLVASPHIGRKLLQTETTPSPVANQYSFFNASCIFLYIQPLVLKFTKPFEQTIYLPNVTQEITGEDRNCSDNFGSFSYNFGTDLPEGLNELSMTLEFTQERYNWKLSAASVKLATGNITSTTFNLDVPQEYDEIGAPFRYSYACPQSPALTSNASQPTAIALVFNNIQAQFNISSTDKFGTSSNCVGFFSIPILSGLMCAVLLIAILIFGVGMIANIQTMDRFDDPKGKGIQINVNE